MPIFDPQALDEAAKRAVIREAESIMVANEDPKALLVRAALDHHTTELGVAIAQKIAGVLQMHDMMSMPHDRSLVEAIYEAMPEVSNQIGMTSMQDTLGEPEHIAGNVETIGYNLAKAARAMFKEPIAANRGKFLAKLGIVKADIDAIQPRTEPKDEAAFADAAIAAAHDVLAPADLLPPPPPHAFVDIVPPALSPEMMALLGMSGDAPPPLPPPAPVQTPPATVAFPSIVPPVAPLSTEVPAAPGIVSANQAIVTFARALTLKDDEFAKRLGISRGTLSNWFNGKSTRPVKVTPEQARLFVAECDFRVSALREAAQVFALLARA